ncbi:MAG TPA: hypothetical protein DDW27_00265 [Bacteroidales bacterium]|nr:hypothetical protein [Bacteroidales bacterium]
MPPWNSSKDRQQSPLAGSSSGMPSDTRCQIFRGCNYTVLTVIINMKTNASGIDQFGPPFMPDKDA